MLQFEKEEKYFKGYEQVEPWKVINELSQEYLNTSNNNEYLIIFTNIKDCNKYPEPFKFVVFNWTNLKVLVYKEPVLKVYSYENYTDAIKNIKGNEEKFLKEGLTIQNHEEYKRLDLLKSIEEKSLIKELIKKDIVIKQGDFLNTSWGYDQTNVELFVIKKIIGNNYLIIQEVAKSIRDDYITSTAVKVSPQIRKVDIPIKAYISNEGYMSICENGYKRSLSLTDINEEHYETAVGFGH
jgi:hypothetical protein